MIRLLGTAHVSRASADAVHHEISTGEWDTVAIELCDSRFKAFENPDAMKNMDLLQVIRSGRAPMVTAMLAMSAFQQRIADQFGIEPGAEMRVAIEQAKAKQCSLELIDREIGTTLKRIYRNVPWWRRFYLFSGLITSVVVHEEIDEQDIEKLKDGDLLETTFAQFAETAAEIYEPLIAERDRYMAAKLRQIASGQSKRVLAVVGAGHLKGLEADLKSAASSDTAQQVINELSSIPPASRWIKAVPWLIVALIFVGFGIGFYRSPALGMTLIVEWIVINGGLAALGTAIAGGHILTIISAFLAAPITSLNPTIGAGFVTALVEAYIRKPTVGDFSNLRSDASSFKGWRSNRVAKTFLVFFLSTLGSAAGTYIAGFRIGQHLFS
ncbi:MAG: TraB/GumN family protein [Proteobacteria bacterium]|nr:TraB/GumN family protein [Pseudomonadota bacterium]